MGSDKPNSPDFYQEWLDIPPGPRPPDHYTLLGLPRFESDPAKIREAARARLKRVRPRCLKHPEAGTRLLNEIATALVCLLDPAAAAAYRRALNVQETGAAIPAANGPAPGLLTLDPAAAAAASPLGEEAPAPANPPAYQVVWDENEEPQVVPVKESGGDGRHRNPVRPVLLHVREDGGFKGPPPGLGQPDTSPETDQPPGWDLIFDDHEASPEPAPVRKKRPRGPTPSFRAPLKNLGQGHEAGILLVVFFGGALGLVLLLGGLTKRQAPPKPDAPSPPLVMAPVVSRPEPQAEATVGPGEMRNTVPPEPKGEASPKDSGDETKAPVGKPVARPAPREELKPAQRPEEKDRGETRTPPAPPVIEKSENKPYTPGDPTEEDLMNEQAAAVRLNLARTLADDGLEAQARLKPREADRLRGHAMDYCRRLMAEYPRTRAAAEAKKLLDKLEARP